MIYRRPIKFLLGFIDRLDLDGLQTGPDWVPKTARANMDNILNKCIVFPTLSKVNIEMYWI